MNYVTQEIKKSESLNFSEPEFNQAVKEVISSAEPLIESSELYKNSEIIKRITEPDRAVKFKVSWMDESGKIHVNRGYRVQFNNALGPYKGGIRFHPSVNISVMKFLAFEQIFKNALTGLPIGGAKGGSDFDPKGKSDIEIMRFCQSFMTELSRYIGPNRDVPAGDMGVGEREIGYLFGQYKFLKNAYEGALSGKSLLCGGSLIRKEATGYGLVYFADEMLSNNNDSIKGKSVCISGSGNVALHAAEKAREMGCKILVMSDSSGWVHSANGINIKTMKLIKETRGQRIEEYCKSDKSSEYHAGKFMWDVPCDMALPCATQNELSEICVKNLISNGVKIIAEGANMPICAEGIDLISKSGVLYAPGKAANAGGVAVSALEMSQNSMRLRWSSSEVDNKLKNIMKEIFNTVSRTALEYGQPKNYMMGANIASFKKVADAMIAQGIY